jgi:hypothetical protein
MYGADELMVSDSPPRPAYRLRSNESVMDPCTTRAPSSSRNTPAEYSSLTFLISRRICSSAVERSKEMSETLISLTSTDQRDTAEKGEERDGGNSVPSSETGGVAIISDSAAACFAEASKIYYESIEDYLSFGKRPLVQFSAQLSGLRKRFGSSPSSFC